MDETRRELLAKAGVAVAGVAGMVAMGAERASAEDKPPKRPTEEKCKPLIAACGLACNTCPLMKAKKCKGCSSGKDATAELLKMKPCPVLKCAAMKKIDYCGTACKMFTKCKKLIGRPYAKSFMAKIAKRLEGEK